MASGERAESRVLVHVDGSRFRIEDEQRIDVYDGTTLCTVFKDVSDTDHAMPGEADHGGAADRTVSAAPRTAAEVRSLRFWENRLEREKGPSGVIARRDTILYEVLDRPDGEFAISCWVDAKTGVVLKSVQTVFARQVESVLVRSGVTCVSIA